VDTASWETLLKTWNDTLFANKDKLRVLPDNLLKAGWLGNPGATQAQIDELEKRLKVKLPTSYVNFLKVTNGWNWHLDHFIYKLWSTEDIDWFSTRNQGWIEVWTAPQLFMEDRAIPDEEYFDYSDDQQPYTLRVEYLKTALEISEEGDGAILLLNPQIKANEGEWEAWYFANWNAGADRYRSFWEMMQGIYRGFLYVLKYEEED
jgi:hypothetical protein